MPVNPHRMFVADRHGTSHAYRRQAYDSDDSSSDDSDQEEFLQFPEDQKRSLNNVALEVARITRKINRLEQYGIPVRANDQAFLSLEESLSVSRWMLQEQIETKMFAYTFSLMVLIPLFICFPIFISTSAEYWDNVHGRDSSTQCDSTNLCVPGKDIMLILWHCSVWLPLIWLLIYGNLTSLVVARLQYAWYFDTEWDNFRKTLEQRRRQDWESNTERASRVRREAKIAHYKRRLKRIHRRLEYCICFPGLWCGLGSGSRDALHHHHHHHHHREQNAPPSPAHASAGSKSSNSSASASFESKGETDVVLETKSGGSPAAAAAAATDPLPQHHHAQHHHSPHLHSVVNHEWNKRGGICGPCICEKNKCRNWIVFVCACVLPLATLIPLWISATLQPDVIDLSLTITGSNGRIIYVASFMTVPGTYCLIQAMSAAIRFARNVEERNRKLKAKAARRKREKRLAAQQKNGGGSGSGSGLDRQNNGGGGSGGIDDDDDDDDVEMVGSSRSAEKAQKKLDSGIHYDLGMVGGDTELANPDPRGRRVLKQKRTCTPQTFVQTILFLVFFVIPLTMGLLSFFSAPDEFFASSLTSDGARLLLLLFAAVPPYFWLLYRGLVWTLVARWPKTGGGHGGSGALSPQSIEKMIVRAKEAGDGRGGPTRGKSTQPPASGSGSGHRRIYDDGDQDFNWDDLDADAVMRRKMNFTNDVGASPRFRTLLSRKVAMQKQRLLDEQLCYRLKWPRWLMYHYPRWSIGHGLITVGERRRLVTFSEYCVDTRRFLIISALFFWIPICVLFPVFYQLGKIIADTDLDPSGGVATRVIQSFMLGYPIAFVLFYTCRLLWGIIPTPVKRTFPTVGVHFFIFVVLPLGVIAPIYETRQLFFSAEVAFFANVVMYALPSSFAALWFSAFFSNLSSVWRWLISLRLEPYVLAWMMKTALKSGVLALALPFPLFVYSSVLQITWEDKDQVALGAFIVISSVASFLILFCGLFSIVAAQWLGHVERVDGIESILPLVGLTLSGINASWGASMLDRFVIQSFPNILERIDEGDLALRSYVVYTQPLFFASGVFALFYYVRTYRRSVDMLRRFGRHPEDWEKSDPSLLTRGLSEAQQQDVQDLEWEDMHKAAVDKERERSWLARPAPVGIEDEFESLIKLHAMNSYMRLTRRRKTRRWKAEKDAAAAAAATAATEGKKNKNKKAGEQGRGTNRSAGGGAGEIEMSTKVR